MSESEKSEVSTTAVVDGLGWNIQGQLLAALIRRIGAGELKFQKYELDAVQGLVISQTSPQEWVVRAE